MVHVQPRACGLVCVCLVAGGCGLPALDTADGCDGLFSGDIVITEVHANPLGADADGEYIELYNASGSVRSLEGSTLVVSRADGTDPRTHRFTGLEALEPSAYFVAGNAGSEAAPSHVNYSYGSSLGNLRNTDGAVSLWCGERLIDRMDYEQTSDGRALELDGALPPDDELNDQAESWCFAPEGAKQPFAGNFGTPGGPNDACSPSTALATCRVGESFRAIVSPQPGEVHITEWMANPTGPDEDLEWVEVTFEAEADLNGFQLGPAPDSLRSAVDQEACISIDAGTRVVFGGSPAAAPRVDAPLELNLPNSGSRSIVAGIGGSVLDSVRYERTTEGVSWQVDSSGEPCISPGGEYQRDNFGTPGEPNPDCMTSPGPGQCVDRGVVRDMVGPLPGQLRITEWMANPTAASNRDGEWVELRLGTDADLNGLVVSDRAGGMSEMQSDACLRFPGGSHVVLARSLDPAVNGGIEGVAAKLSVSLNNSDETITLSLAGQVLDSVSYEESEPGVAVQVDELGNVCHAVQAYGEGDFGTPGAPNSPCF